MRTTVDRVEPFWSETRGSGPLVAVALHHGHELRDEVAERIALDPAERLREEDPHTGDWTVVAPTRVVVHRSRFEVDLNRPRDRAVYRTPEDAWDLEVWREPPPEEIVERSLAQYDLFYDRMRELLRDVEADCGRFVVFDLHSYNHRRDGPDRPVASPETHPQVNVGTDTLDRDRWGSVVDRFIQELRAFDFPGGRLDVRENVKFRGGHFARWVHETFPETGCALAIEFKKFFMDEWSGRPDPTMVGAIRDALRSTVDGVREALER